MSVARARLVLRFRGLMLLAASLAFGGCGESPAGHATQGDPENGRLLLRQFGCGSCHRIPGVANAFSEAAPPLDNVGSRIYLAGLLPNTPENMARWIRSPQAIAPGTAMPDLQVTAAQAQDMTAYLQTLR